VLLKVFHAGNARGGRGSMFTNGMKNHEVKIFEKF
jgi:hypothetical protein